MTAYGTIYTTALAQLHVIQEACAARIALLPEWNTEEELEAFTAAEIAIEEELGLPAAMDALRVAETALLNFARGKVQELPEYAAHAADVEKVLGSTNYAIRQKALTLAARLSA